MVDASIRFAALLGFALNFCSQLYIHFILFLDGNLLLFYCGKP